MFDRTIRLFLCALAVSLIAAGLLAGRVSPFAAFGIGLLSGEVFDFIFDVLTEEAKRAGKKGGVEGEIGFLHWIEHYHWGLILLTIYDLSVVQSFLLPESARGLFELVIASPFLIGLGLSLILDENRSDARFGWSKHPEEEGAYYHFYESSVIGIFLGIVLVLRWLPIPIAIAVTLSVTALVAAIILVWRKPAKPRLSEYRISLFRAE